MIEQLTQLEPAQREDIICAEILRGNVPQFLRQFCPVRVIQTNLETIHTLTFYAAPDYLALGADDDYFLAPISPAAAQRIAEALKCTLPTRKMVDQIYSNAVLKLIPSPIPPSPAMTSVPVFAAHNATIWRQRNEQLKQHPLGALVAGHKKDVVLTPRLASAPGKLAIYGWHQTNGRPIQPLYLGHSASWVDYSQCIRLVQQALVMDGRPNTVSAILTDEKLSGLLSDEGVFSQTSYLLAAKTSTAAPASSALPVDPLPATSLEQFTISPFFSERVTMFTNRPGVRVHVNAPSADSFAPGKKVLLVLFALPNGNTIEQTIGKRLKPGDDWHFDIQHIGAQTRFLRQLLPEQTIVVAYLENSLKSWPAWRKKWGDDSIPGMVQSVKSIFENYPVEIALNGHSGGGSFIFGYLNAVDKIPAQIVRIGFLDSNYAYDRTLGHDQKLAAWLKQSTTNALCVLAYNDAVALLNGKTFVSTSGGTWGRSHAMQRDLAEYFSFSSRTNGDLRVWTALEGRIQLLLKENPDKKILHTVQVERNGFIHSLLAGTPKENSGYEYFGPRAYSDWIQSEKD